jgi:hypothetical protein
LKHFFRLHDRERSPRLHSLHDLHLADFFPVQNQRQKSA